MIPISGDTRLLPIIGEPTRQVKAPAVFNAYFAETRQDVVMTAFELSGQGVDSFIEAIRGCANAVGFIATIPHKQRAAAACDALTERAAFLGATNLIRREADGRLIGDMTDGLGCVQAMRVHGVDPARRRALVVGVGGAGSAIAHALAEAGVTSLCLTDIDEGRTRRIAARLADAFPGLEVQTSAPAVGSIDIAVNASPVGMNDDPNMPYELDGIADAALVADVVTNPEMTPWLKAAAARGWITQSGIDMVRGQFALMKAHFRFT